MKKFSLLVATLFSLNTFAQYHVDYYDYVSNPILPSNSHASGTDLVTDGAGATFYVNSDSKIHKLTKSGTIWTDVNLNSSTVRTNGGLLYAMWKVFYIDNGSGKVYNAYQSGGSWFYNALSYSAPGALTGTNITVDENGVLYYVDATTSKINKFWWNGSAWQYAALSVPGFYAVKSNNKIYYNAGHIFYVGTDNKIYNLYLSAGNWYNSILNGSSPLAMDGTSLFQDVVGKVYYISQAGNICNYTYETYGWSVAGILNASAPKAKTTGDFIVNNNSEIYYVTDVNGFDEIFYMVWADCKWFWTTLNTQAYPVKNFSGLLVDNSNTVFYTGTDNKIHIYNTQINETTHPYVYVKGKDLMFQGQKYKPKVLNYGVDINTNDFVNYWPGPWKNNFNCCVRYSNNPTIALQKIRADFDYIKNVLGYDAIRLVGPTASPNHTTTDLNLYFNAVTPAPTYTSNSHVINTPIVCSGAAQTSNFNIVKDLINEAGAKGLKVIYLAGSNASRNNMTSVYNSYLNSLSLSIGNNTNLLAYDIYNEPANDWSVNDMSKTQICSAVDTWYNTIRANTANLVTLGQFGINDVHAWDPAIQTIDFYSCHIYDYNRSDTYTNKINRVQGEMLWYSRNLTKPWILGESGMSTDPFNTYSLDDGSTTDQSNFANATMSLTVQGGGVGYSWWTFHDDVNQNPGAYYGLLYNDPSNPITVPTATLTPVNYLYKPAATTIKNFNLNQSCSSISQPTNYYDPYNNSLSPQVYGTIVDENNNPIRDAVVMEWPALIHTYTDANGSYHLPLLSSDANRHLKISSVGRTATSLFIGTGSPSSFGTTQIIKVASCDNYTHRQAVANEEIKNPTSLSADQVNVFPNPTSNFVSINGVINATRIDVIDITGKLCLSIPASKDQENYTIENMELVNGMYFIRINCEDNTSLVKKMIISK